MLSFPIQIDTIGYKAKPKGSEVGAIKPRLAQQLPQNCTIEQLAAAVENGKTFQPGILIGGAKVENWRYQQLFCIDVDNTEDYKDENGKKQKRRAANPLTIKEVLSRSKQWGIMPALIYETFSSSADWLKFRVVFISAEIITDAAKRDGLQLAIQEIFPESDVSCKDRCRIFYGGKSIIYRDDNASFNPKSLEHLAESVINKQRFADFDKRKRSGADSELEELKRNYDFLSYIRSFGGSERRAGKVTVFNPCPICGHNDDFCFYSDTNTFMCFGANGDKGGTVIDFIKYTQNKDTAAAIDYFKYELCGLPRPENKAEQRISIMRSKAEQKGIEIKNNELPPYIFYKENERTGEVTFCVSCPLLAKYIREHCQYISVQDKLAKTARLFWYSDGVYAPISDDMLKGHIKGFITAVDETLLKMRDVREVAENIKSDLKAISEDKLNANEDIINFKNGLFSLSQNKLLPHTPDELTTIQLPCNYNEAAKNAPVFNSYLNTLTDGNEDKKRLLLQFMGVAISNICGYRFKKALFMYGRGDTGKSQLKALTEKLLGIDNCSSIDLKELESRFGKSQMYSKRLVGSGDMSFADVGELKIFKCATGGDNIFVEFKGKDGFSFRYKGVMWFCMNELPRFGGDRGEWVYERILPFECKNVIPKEKQDKRLLEKMWGEREAIVNMLISAVHMVILNGYNYTVPNSVKIARERYRINNSTVLTFFDECCIMRAAGDKFTDRITTGKLYEVFKAWHRKYTGGNSFAPSVQKFKKEIAEYLNISAADLEKRNTAARYYAFTLNQEAREEFHNFLF